MLLLSDAPRCGRRCLTWWSWAWLLRYELNCNLPNHYADGMYEQLVVT
jgi:hypothetical protein